MLPSSRRPVASSPPGPATADRPRRRAPAVAPPPIPPTGFTVEAAPPGYLALCWRAGLWSTGGPTTAGSAVPPLASARAAPSRTWWPTTGRLRRCAALQTRSLTPTPTVPDGCFSRLPLRRVWPGPFDHWPLRLSLVSGLSQLLPGSGGQRIFAKNFLLLPVSAQAAFQWSQDSRLDWRRTAGLHLALNICGSSHGQR